MLNAAIKVSFQKVRTTKNSNGRLESLYVARNKIKEHNEKDHDDKLAHIESEIADEAWRIVKEETRGFASDGGYNPGHLWKLKDKIIPKLNQVPTAMKGPVDNY